MIEINLNYVQLNKEKYLDLKSDLNYNIISENIDLLKFIIPKNIININGYNINNKLFNKIPVKNIFLIVYKFEENIWYFYMKDGLLHSLHNAASVHKYKNIICKADTAYYINGKIYSFDEWKNNPIVIRNNRKCKLKFV